ncbi:RNA polymerase subunit sigma [Desulfopila sp. IMCC35006]|uniref:SIR2 family NAD-dependent protein deacylase n=1 Tax=Desulfopila sp. IMCC35006 TaxID=2569542 RepID=UPI0010AB584C|nr:Sir2 family NAD-dependent protein deacetylase [Desulfopila sp. IMCC35006]TKB25613.1 RNA polymerase subunit sigma [Desulfopila sp. IMCC35006]
MKTIIFDKSLEYLAEAVDKFKTASCPVALTGAGISVNSGIADFRSPGGVWTIFSPDEYATLNVFLKNPQKAWKLYREMGKGLLGKKPNQAHKVLADFEHNGLLRGLVTQNVDNLHQAAGSLNVLEIHGDHQHLQCLWCETVVPVTGEHYAMSGVPACTRCNSPLKPNVVLFGEAVRSLDAIEELIFECDLLLVIGTSAQVYPAAGLPVSVKERGGLIYEFNQEPALSAHGYAETTSFPDYFFAGDLAATLPLFGRRVFGT